jgi:steroid delta-isomerase-like uncharacterized protein
MAVPDLVAAWNTHDPGKVAELFASGGVRHQIAGGARLAGREEIRFGVGAIMESFPDFVLGLAKRSDNADGSITWEWTWRGTHERDLFDLPGRGKVLDFRGVSVCEMDGDLIREERVYWDNATALAAQGALG